MITKFNSAHSVRSTLDVSSIHGACCMLNAHDLLPNRSGETEVVSAALNSQLNAAGKCSLSYEILWPCLSQMTKMCVATDEKYEFIETYLSGRQTQNNKSKRSRKQRYIYLRFSALGPPPSLHIARPIIVSSILFQFSTPNESINSRHQLNRIRLLIRMCVREI